MNLTKEKRWLVEGLHDVCEVDAVVQKGGKVFMYSYDGEEFLHPSKDDFFSLNKEKAEKHRKSIIPKNINQVRKYLSLLVQHGQEEELKAILPNNIWSDYRKGYEASIGFTWTEQKQIESAIAGRINIGGYSFCPSAILSVRYIGDSPGNITVILTNGKEITTRTRTERIIIEATMGKNNSGVHFNK